MGVGKSTFAFTNSSITIDGGSTTINITRDNQSYSHKLSHGYGDIATLAVGTTSYTWKPTASQLTKFLEEVPSQKSRLIDVSLYTYNGSTLVGRDVHALTVTLSEATGKPTVSGFSITDSNTTANGLGIIVYGKSNLTATATPTGKYGATISRNIFTCDYNGNHYESYYINDLIASLPLTTTPTSFTFGYKTTDSRGFSTTSTLSKTVVGYQAPHIDTFEVIRCDATGNESDIGPKAKVIIAGSWAAIKVGTAYKNPATLKVGYKTKDATSYTYESFPVSAGTVSISEFLIAKLDTDTDYEFSVQLTDSFETYSETGVGCSNVKNILYVSADGEEVVIGSDTGNNVAIDSDSVDIRDGSTTLASFTKDTIELGKNSTKSKISMMQDSFAFSNEQVSGYQNNFSSIASDGNFRINSNLSCDQSGTGANFNQEISMYANSVGNNVIPSETGIMLSSGVRDGSAAQAHTSLLLGTYLDTAGTTAKSKISIETSKNSGDLDDWVVAQGRSGNWTYSKWASGFAECYGWGRTTAKSITLVSGGRGYYDSTITGGMALPFTFKSSPYAPYCSITLMDPDGYMFFVQVTDATTTKAATGYFYSLVSHTSTVILSYYVRGYWK